MILSLIFLALISQAKIQLAPLESKNWQVISYNNNRNKLSSSAKGLTISINKSSSAVIHVFKKSTSIKNVTVKGKITSGQLNIPTHKQQGSRFYDDFIFRLGLIVEGDRRLTWLERLIAPKWVLELQNLGPKNKGIKQVNFFNVSSQPISGNKRLNNKSNKFFVQETVSLVNPDGTFSLNKKIESNNKHLGLWLSSDGDDTNSTFTVLIEKIEYSE